MKKLLGCVVAAASIFALAGCGSAGGAGGSPYTITEGDGVIGYFTFDEDEIEDNEVIDHSGNEANIYSAALDGSVLVDGKHGNAMAFSGEDEYLTLDSELISGDGFTVACWVKAASWPVWARVFDFGDCKTDLFVAVDGRIPGTLVFYEESTGSSCNSPLPPVGSWVHVAAAYGNGKMALFVNGKKAQELDCPVALSTIYNEDNLQMFVGRSNWADPLFCGAIDDLLLANRRMSDAEIKSVYAGVIAPDAAE